MVKQLQVWKLTFFKNDDANCGAQNEAIKACTSEQIVVHSQTVKNGRMWGCATPSQFLKLIEKNHGLYEVMTRFPHKVYFDIDKQGQAEEGHLQNIKNIILQYFPNAEMAISGSIKESKTSHHIVLQNYVIHNEEERQYMKHLVKYICENQEESFDWKVYTKNRNMKCINQSKDDGRVQEIIENPDFKAHCITCFVSDYSLPFSELPEEIKTEVMVAKSKGTFDLGQLPKLVLSTPVDFDIVSADAEECFALLPLNTSFNHDYTHLVARFCFYNAIPFEKFLTWLSQKHTPMTVDVANKWKNHWSKLDKFPPVSKSRIISMLKYFYPHITKDIHYRRFVETFNLPKENIQKIETISQECFNTPHKFKIFNVGMGGGKTAQTISYLKNQANFLWIAPNRALATNTHKRFETEGIDVTHYETIKTKDKKEGKMKEVKKLICCLHSTHYLGDADFEVLVIDEIETVFDIFLGDFLEQGKNQYKKTIWNIFLNLFRKAKTVLLLDAFITAKTIQFVRELRELRSPNPCLEDAVIFERMFEPQTRTIQYMDGNDPLSNFDGRTSSMLQDIINKLRQGSKIFIFYPYKNASNNWYSMEQIYGMITQATGTKGIFYNADVDDKVKKGLKDVNESWKDANFVITNNIITCGVNYENTDFDIAYLFIASHNTPRDMIQVSYRVRQLISGIIKICFMGKMNQSNTWLNDCDKIGCPIYKKMHQQILIEKKAPLRRAFQVFCTKAHYKQKTDEFKINELVNQELRKMLDEQELGVSYASIPDIDWSQAECIEEECFAQQATMMDKCALNKYYFKKSFKDAKESELAMIWDSKSIFFFQRLSQILTDKENVFNKIAELNKLPHLFPNGNIKNLKLDEQIKTQIFKDFSFKYITKDSFTPKILKEIYNTYFAKNIVCVDFDANKHAIYYVCELAPYSHHYDFAKEHLILDVETSMTYNALQENRGEHMGVVEI